MQLSQRSDNMKIHQILPALSYGDAVSNDAIEIRHALRRMGYSSDIFAKYIHPKVSKFAKHLNQYKKNASNIVICHFSVAGSDVTEFVKTLPDVKILKYHNITPHHFFNNINDELYNICRYGREELKTLNKVVKLALGDSEYNKKELDFYGFNNTGVLPILIDYSKYDLAPNKKIMKTYDDDYINLLFVGRIAPNKKQEDLIKIFYYYKKINTRCRLFIVGSYIGMEKYFAQLQEMVRRLNLIDVVFTGHTSFDEMIAYYRLSDVFLCMSEHEGFCVPLIESMYFNIPIVAYNSTAIPYTLTNCGILVNEKRYDEIAETINLLVNDAVLRKKIIEKQNIQLKDFERSKIEEKLKNYIEYIIHSKEKEEKSLKIIKKFAFVSVVICTYNRANYLERCIESLRKQTYPNFEIIVVNGPSTDETNKILERYQEIKIVKQEKLNGLSFARNLGIGASNGEIVAFIDDDAVADENWIKYLVEGYIDESIGGVGGLVYGPKKTHLQFDRGTINKCGIPTAIRNDGELKKDEFSIIMGTNSSFRKDILCEIGGFDIYFRYYHDESDLCIRIAKKGYKIVYQKDAFVIHDMAEGHNRKSLHDLNWSEIMKNIIYFTLKNFGEEFSSYTIRPIKSLRGWSKYFYSIYCKKDMSRKQLFDIYLKLIRGAMKGYIDGLRINLSMSTSLNTYKYNNISTISYKKLADTSNLNIDQMLKICFLSQEFSKNCNGGVCRYTYDLAHTLAELGNEVHIITHSKKDCEYEYRDRNVLVHAVIPQSIDFLGLSNDMSISRKNLSYSYSVCTKLFDLIEKYRIQIVEAPLWDAEAFIFSLVKPISLIIRLETPLFKVIEIQGWQITKDLKFANWMEGETVRRADKAIAISKDIGSLISSHHNISEERIDLCPLGIEVPDENLLINEQKKNGFNVLFVGRLEKRKGIETLFKAIPIVLEKVPDTQFYIVGADTNLAPDGDSYKKYLLKNLDKIYHTNVKFIGYVDDIELKNYYKNCDIFVAPSLYESFGLIYLESMAWGKPAIGCNVGGIPEIVEDGKDGALIQPNDEKSLARTITKLLTDKDIRVKMGKNGRKKIETDFSTRKMAEKTFEIYKNIVIHTNVEGSKNLQISHHERMNKAMSNEKIRNQTIQQLHFRYKTYLKELFPSKPCKVLDIGCGYAEIFFKYLLERGHTYYGVDLSEDVVHFMEKIANVQGNDAYIKAGKLESIPFEDNKFDVVYVSHVLEHTFDIIIALDECKRVLKDNGCIVFAVPCGYDEEPAHTHKRTKDEWREDFERNGLLIERDGQFEFNNNEYYGLMIKRR